MKTRKKQTHAARAQKRTLFMKLSEKAMSLGKKFVAVKNYFKKTAISAISTIKNVVQHKKDRVVKKSVAKKPTNKNPAASVAHKKRAITAKKKVASAKAANDINIYV